MSTSVAHYENVTFKVNSRCFKLYRSYSISFNSSDVGEFYFNSIVKDCIKVQKKKKEVVVFTLCTKREIKRF